MGHYIAFLRAVNLGARNKISIAGQIELFTRLGCRAVRAYLQTGNLWFEREDVDGLAAQAESILAAEVGPGTAVMIRPLAEVQALVHSHPFALRPAGERRYASFLALAPAQPLALPAASPKGDLLLLEQRGLTVLSVVLPVDGASAEINGLVERKTGVLATTRAWSTVEKVVERARI